MSTILIYDQNVESLQVMEQKLVCEGYSVKACSDAVESLKYAENNKGAVSMLITNYTIDSFSLNDYLAVIRKLCEDISVVVVSSSNDISEEVRSMNLNVDEYIRKPIPSSVFIKRIERVYEYRSSYLSKIKIERDNVEVDLVSHHIYVHGELVSLTLREYQLLTYLIRRKNRVISRSELVTEIWGQEPKSSNLRIIDVNISNLRKTLNLTSLVTVRGLGYKLEI